MQAAVNHEAHQSRRAAILEAAEAVFAAAGYDRARLEDVAGRVGIRRASLLYHFRDKGSLYASVLASMGDDLARRFGRALDGKGPAGARIERTVDAWLDFIAARPALVRIMLRELADGASEHSRSFAEQSLAVLGAVRALIDAGQAQGELLKTNGLQVLSAVMGASAFLTLGGPLLGSSGAGLPPTIAERAEHRALLVAMFRKFLGTHRARPVLESIATDR